MANVVTYAFSSFAAISALALEPAISASLLAIIRYAPAEFRARYLDIPTLRSSIGANATSRMLRILFALGLVRCINRAMNSWALNNWRASAQVGWEWSKEIAVVTGGCSGIGKAIALGLAIKGVKVAVLDIQELPDDMRAIDGIRYFRCDITSAAAVTEAGDAVRKTLGHPSILINNAGIALSHSIVDASDESLRKIFSVNLIALWSTTKDCLPNMILQNKGHIVTIASIASFMALPGAVDYSATKAGALAFHEGLACEIKHIYKAPGIITTVVHPSWVRTQMTQQYAERIERRQGKMMTPDEIASRVVKQIFKRKGGQLIIPSRVSNLSGIRGWPNWLQEWLRDSAGTLR
jgi:all-trans-retinol dehydrogenase (NAD+)